MVDSLVIHLQFETLTVLQFTGQINLPKTGLWSFSLASDDGSILYIDGAMFINNDGGCPLPISKIIFVIIIITITIIIITPYSTSLSELPPGHTALSKQLLYLDWSTMKSLVLGNLEDTMSGIAI